MKKVVKRYKLRKEVKETILSVLIVFGLIAFTIGVMLLISIIECANF